MEKFRKLYNRHLSIQKETAKIESQIEYFLRKKQELEEKRRGNDF